MRKARRKILSEAKKDLELGVVKSLSFAPLRPEELLEILAVTEADLCRDYGCDLYMAEMVKQHATHEQYRLRAQNQFTPSEDIEGLFPEKPYTRTAPISEASERRTARGTVRNIAADANRLHHLLDDQDDLPKWCKHKITQARMMTESVREYLEQKFENPSEDLHDLDD
tara:strand:+ start:1169 stop:1675 length:507 start_codon:yes stop_codon:yes gene_type:complete